MPPKILVLNTLVTDFRLVDKAGEEFGWVDELVGQGGLAKLPTENMPHYSQAEYIQWVQQERRTGERVIATAGGPGNCAPLMAQAGIDVTVYGTLGKGSYNGLDAQGRFFCDTMKRSGVSIRVDIDELPTGTTFVHILEEEKQGERGGIAYFPNANNNFSFEKARQVVQEIMPNIVYSMYHGLSRNGDANEGRDLADFIDFCNKRRAVTIVDTHTLASDPSKIKRGQPVEAYKSLENILPKTAIFFSSLDEAKMVCPTLFPGKSFQNMSDTDGIKGYLGAMINKFCQDPFNRTRLFGVTVKDGAYEKHFFPGKPLGKAKKVKSGFLTGESTSLIGAGDSFRAGLLTYIAHNLEKFENGELSHVDIRDALQMGNLFATLYIESPFSNRYSLFKKYSKMLDIVQGRETYRSFDGLVLSEDLGNLDGD